MLARLLSVAAVAGITGLAACASDDPTAVADDDLTACSATSPRSKPLQLFVWPEAGEAPLVEVLHGAQKSIHLMVYMLGEDGVFDALKERAAAGAEVRVILDGGAKKPFNQPAFDALTAAGVQVQWSDPKFAFMHAKSFVVDGKTAMISTGNFPKNLIATERNYVVRDDNARDAKSLETIFDADWSKHDPDLSCTRLIASPVNSRSRILDLVKAAKHSLLVESLELSDPDVINAIIDRKHAGLDVRVLLADPSWDGSGHNALTAKRLDAEGIPTRTIPKSRMLVHVKSILVDTTQAYLGSENLTTNSLEHNREVGLLVLDKPSLGTMHTTFEADFASANAL